MKKLFNGHFKQKLILRMLVFSMVVCVSFPLTGCFLFPTEEKIIAPTIKEPPKVVYDTEEVKVGNIEQVVEGFGVFVSTSQTNFFFKEKAGRLKKVYVSNGDKVKKGDLLVELLTENIESQVKQQEIVLEKTKLSLDNTKINGEREIRRFKLMIEDLMKQLNKAEKLKDSYSTEYIENLKSEIKKQEFELDGITVNFKTNLKQAQHDYELQKIRLNDLKSELEKSRLVSTVDGEICYVMDIKEGEYFEPYKTVITIADPNRLQLEYKGDNAIYFELGMKPKVIINSKECSGEVVMCPQNDPTAEIDSINKSVRISVDKIPKGVTYGDAANIKLTLGRKENVVILPKVLIHKESDRKFVQIIENEVRRERDIQVGMENATEVEIISGLAKGDKVVKE